MRKKSWWTFRIFLIFSAQIPRGGGSEERGGGGEGLGRCLQGFFGWELNTFFGAEMPAKKRAMGQSRKCAITAMNNFWTKIGGAVRVRGSRGSRQIIYVSSIFPNI